MGGHLSAGASSAVGYPHGQKHKGTFVRGPTQQIEPLHHRNVATPGESLSGIQPTSRMLERPFERNFRGTSREEPPEARLSVTPPPFPPGKEKISLLDTPA